MRPLVFLAACIGLAWAQASLASPLLTLNEQGQPQPALARSVETLADGRVALTIDPAKLASVRQTLAEKAPELTVTEDDAKRLLVAGLPAADLLKKLAALDIPNPTDEGDALFAALPKGDTLAMASSDGASSVRVSKPATEAGALARQFTARVVKVERAPRFPEVIVTVKMETPPMFSVQGGADIKRGDTLRLRPRLRFTGPTNDTAPDFSDRASQLNAGAWFLEKGDLVVGELSTLEQGVYLATLLQRKL